MRICVIIVTYNRSASVREALLALAKQSFPAAYLVVVNNGSTDETMEVLSDFRACDIFPLHLPTNEGFGYGLSMGMKYALRTWRDFDYFLLLDDDSRPTNDYLKTMSYGRKVVDKPGIICTMGFVDSIWKGPVSIYNSNSKNKRLLSSSPLIYQVDHVLVDGALVDRSVVERIGTLREDVFMMCEDAEYSKRIRKSGYSICVLVDDELIDRLHMGGGDRFTFSTRWRGYYHARNHMMILKNYFSWKLLFSYIIRQFKYLLASLKAPDRFERVRLRLLGIFHGIIGKMGKTLDPEVYKNQRKS